MGMLVIQEWVHAGNLLGGGYVHFGDHDVEEIERHYFCERHFEQYIKEVKKKWTSLNNLKKT